MIPKLEAITPAKPLFENVLVCYFKQVILAMKKIHCVPLACNWNTYKG